MKFIVILMMLSSILLSWQKQIILGSYSVEGNGKKALSTINKQIENDAQLQELMKKYSLSAINTVISGYTVVSVNTFDSFTPLLNTMKVLESYYPDIFVLRYPTTNITLAESIEEIESKAKVENEIEEVSTEEKRVALKTSVEDEAPKSELVEEVVFEEKLIIETKESIQEPQEATKIKESTVETSKIEEPTVLEGLTSFMKEYILYIIGIIVLIVLGLVLFIVANTSKTKKQE